MKLLRKTLVFLLIMFSAGGLIAADDIPTLDEMDEDIELVVSSPGGTPLLLEFTLIDPKGYVSRAAFDFHRNGVINYAVSLPIEEDPEDEEENDGNGTEPAIYRGIPFKSPGYEHSLEIQLETEAGTLTRRYTIAFADFLWGRDNLSFANDNTFRSKVNPASDYLLSWAESRFGDLDKEEEFLLVSLMYRMFRGNIGRCYGFSSAGLYFKEFPEVLSAEYRKPYDLSENDPEVQELIHSVQNDIMFEILAAQNVSFEMENQEPQNLFRKLDLITSHIHKERPVSVGYLSRRTHHSMVVFGYIYDEHQDRMNLTAANNWRRDQRNNLSSEDALIIPFYWDGDFYTFDWLRHTYREEDRLFVVDPRREYHHDRKAFEHVLAQERQMLIEGEKHLVIAEHAGWAFAEDEQEARRGHDGNRNYWGIPNIAVRRFDDIHILEIPASLDVSLLTGRNECEDNQQCTPFHLYIALHNGDGMIYYSRRNINYDSDFHEVYELDPNVPLEAKRIKRQ